MNEFDQMEYEMLCEELTFAEEALLGIQAEVESLKARKREMEEARAVTDSDHWTGPDDSPWKGRRNKYVDKYAEIMKNGSREDRHLYHMTEEFHNLFCVSMMENLEDVSPEYIKMYSLEQTEQFAGAIVGTTSRMGFLVDEINVKDADGKVTEVQGYLIPWAGNFGPVGSRKRFEEYWAHPRREESLHRMAIWRTRSLDAEYRRMVGAGAEEFFMKKHPWYVPA